MQLPTFNQTAVTTYEDEECHQVVIDLRYFHDGDVKVEVVDEKDLLVEGNVGVEEELEGDVGGDSSSSSSSSSASENSFRRRFSFPNMVRLECVSSKMSLDGILTVTVPKNRQTYTTDMAKNEIDFQDTGDSDSNPRVTGNSNPRVTGNNDRDSRVNYTVVDVTVPTTTSTAAHHHHDDEEDDAEWEENSCTNDPTAELRQLHLVQLPATVSQGSQSFLDSVLFFSETRKDFEEEVTVRQVLDTWGGEGAEKVLDTWGGEGAEKVLDIWGGEGAESDDDDDDWGTCYKDLPERGSEEEGQDKNENQTVFHDEDCYR